MRLTLRSLLAYHDDQPLSESNRSSIETQLRESERSVQLRERIVALATQPRMAAPNIHVAGTLDPNNVAQYIDNSLAAELCPQFERSCLKSDAALAEVAAVHQIVCRMTEQPANIPARLRDRVYQVPQELKKNPQPVAVNTETTTQPESITTDAAPTPRKIGRKALASAANVLAGISGSLQSKINDPESIEPSLTKDSQSTAAVSAATAANDSEENTSGGYGRWIVLAIILLLWFSVWFNFPAFQSTAWYQRIARVLNPVPTLPDEANEISSDSTTDLLAAQAPFDADATNDSDTAKNTHVNNADANPADLAKSSDPGISADISNTPISLTPPKPVFDSTRTTPEVSTTHVSGTSSDFSANDSPATPTAAPALPALLVASSDASSSAATSDAQSSLQPPTDSITGATNLADIPQLATLESDQNSAENATSISTQPLAAASQFGVSSNSENSAATSDLPTAGLPAPALPAPALPASSLPSASMPLAAAPTHFATPTTATESNPSAEQNQLAAAVRDLPPIVDEELESTAPSSSSLSPLTPQAAASNSTTPTTSPQTALNTSSNPTSPLMPSPLLPPKTEGVETQPLTPSPVANSQTNISPSSNLAAAAAQNVNNSLITLEQQTAMVAIDQQWSLVLPGGIGKLNAKGLTGNWKLIFSGVSKLAAGESQSEPDIRVERCFVLVQNENPNETLRLRTPKGDVFLTALKPNSEVILEIRPDLPLGFTAAETPTRYILGCLGVSGTFVVAHNQKEKALSADDWLIVEADGEVKERHEPLSDSIVQSIAYLKQGEPLANVSELSEMLAKPYGLTLLTDFASGIGGTDTQLPADQLAAKRSLAGTWCYYLGRMEPIAHILNDPTMKDDWTYHIDAVRDCLLSEPAALGQLQSALGDLWNDEQLAKRIVGYYAQTFQASTMKSLVDDLSNPGIARRVLAIHALKQLWQKDFGYDPMGETESFKASITQWRQLYEESLTKRIGVSASRELVPNTQR